MHLLARHWIENVVLQAPVARTLGITVRSADVDRVILLMPFSEALTTTPGVLHGGVIATSIDTVGAAASASGVSPDDEASGGILSTLSRFA